MEKLSREEIEMCQMAVAIVTDTRDLTDGNKAKWDMLWERLDVMQKEACRPTPLAPDVATATPEEEALLILNDCVEKLSRITRHAGKA